MMSKEEWREAKRAAGRKYKATHKKKIAKYRATHKKESKAYYVTHKEEIKAQRAKYRAEHMEEDRQRQAKYRATHKKESKAYFAKYNIIRPAKGNERRSKYSSLVHFCADYGRDYLANCKEERARLKADPEYKKKMTALMELNRYMNQVKRLAK